MVVAADEYDRLRRLDRADAPSFTDLLLAIPLADEPFERAAVCPRDVEL